MSQAYLIDPLTRSLREIAGGYEATKEYMPGGIAVAWRYPNGDVLYADDEGLLRRASMAFRIRSRPDGQPMMSRGIVHGPDDLWSDQTLTPRSTMADIEADIEWLTVEEALAWFRAKAAEPAMTREQGGNPVEVWATWADFLRNLEGGRGFHPEDLKGKL